MVLLMPMTFVGKPLERKLRVSRYIMRYRYGLWYPHLAPRPRSKIEATLSRAKRPLGRIDWVDARMGWIVELMQVPKTSQTSRDSPMVQIDLVTGLDTLYFPAYSMRPRLTLNEGAYQ